MSSNAGHPAGVHGCLQKKENCVTIAEVRSGRYNLYGILLWMQYQFILAQAVSIWTRTSSSLHSFTKCDHEEYWSGVFRPDDLPAVVVVRLQSGSSQYCSLASRLLSFQMESFGMLHKYEGVCVVGWVWQTKRCFTLCGVLPQ